MYCSKSPSTVYICVFSVLLVACARPTLTAELSPRSLRAVNLEETLSRRDELMLAYTLTSYDARNRPAGVVNGGWGVETVRKGQSVDLRTARLISLPMPRNGRVVASVVLIEVDDYGRAKDLLGQVARIHNLVSVPASLLTATEVLTPIKYVTAGLTAAGVALNVVDRLDTDDVLGQSSTELTDRAVRRAKQSVVSVPAEFTGRHRRDSFTYRLEYDIQLKQIRMRPSANK